MFEVNLGLLFWPSYGCFLFIYLGKMLTEACIHLIHFNFIKMNIL